MKRRYVLFLVFAALSVLLLHHTSLSGVGEKVHNAGNIENLDLGKNIQREAVVKPGMEHFKLPLYFIANQGQVNDKAKFYAKASRYTLWLTKDGLVFDRFKKIEGSKERSRTFLSESKVKDRSLSETTSRSRYVSRLLFIGANKNPEIVPVERASLKVNYFIGNDKSKWRCDVPTSAAVLYKNLYENIDLKVYGIDKQVEYDWIVKPGGDSADIRFKYKNVKESHIDEEGNLVISTEFGELIHKKPVGYQESCPFTPGNDRESIEVKFGRIGRDTYGFKVGDYDKNRILIIDPIIVLYSSYLGGWDNEDSKRIAVDRCGNAYVTGYTYSHNFPTRNAYQDERDCCDAFITRLDTNQSGISSLIYSTFLGGDSTDEGSAIAVGRRGNVYVTGLTNSDNFPTRNPFQGNFGGGRRDAFVTKLDTNQSGESSLIYSTYLGGLESDNSTDIAIDGRGNAYVTGYTDSHNFPICNPYQVDQRGCDVFITKLDTNQAGVSSLSYSTYLGGGGSEYGRGIAVESRGNVYVTGYTFSHNFPTRNPYQLDQGKCDVFVTKLNTNQKGISSLIYSSYLGGKYCQKFFWENFQNPLFSMFFAN